MANDGRAGWVRREGGWQVSNPSEAESPGVTRGLFVNVTCGGEVSVTAWRKYEGNRRALLSPTEISATAYLTAEQWAALRALPVGPPGLAPAERIERDLSEKVDRLEREAEGLRAELASLSGLRAEAAELRAMLEHKNEREELLYLVGRAMQGGRDGRAAAREALDALAEVGAALGPPAQPTAYDAGPGIEAARLAMTAEAQADAVRRDVKPQNGRGNLAEVLHAQHGVAYHASPSLLPAPDPRHPWSALTPAQRGVWEGIAEAARNFVRYDVACELDACVAIRDIYALAVRLRGEAPEAAPAPELQATGADDEGDLGDEHVRDIAEGRTGSFGSMTSLAREVMRRREAARGGRTSRVIAAVEEALKMARCGYLAEVERQLEALAKRLGGGAPPSAGPDLVAQADREAEGRYLARIARGDASTYPVATTAEARRGALRALAAMAWSFALGGVSASNLAEMLGVRAAEAHPAGLQAVANALFDAATTLPEALREIEVICRNTSGDDQATDAALGALAQRLRAAGVAQPGPSPAAAADGGAS